MKKENLAVSVRPKAKKSILKQRRKDGVIPGNIYGLGKDNASVDISLRDIKKILNGPFGKNTVVDLSVDDQNAGTALPYQIQRHPVTDEMTHIDFLLVDDQKKIVVTLPLNLRGTAPGVKKGGRLQQKIKAVRARLLAKDIPQGIDIDVSSFEVGDSLRIRDLKLADGIEILTQGSQMILQIELPRGKKADDAQEGDSDSDNETAAE